MITSQFQFRVLAGFISNNKAWDMTVKRSYTKTITTAGLIHLYLYLSILLLFASCTQPNQQIANEKIVKDSMVSPHVAILSNLSEANQPKKILLGKAPKPLTIKLTDKFIVNKIQQSTSEAAVADLSPQVTHSFLDNTINLPVKTAAQGKGFFTTYNTDNGLALDQIYCSYKDKTGNLWFGTNGGGVSKYDGKSFTNYTTTHGLANNVVWSIMEDKKGNIWFGTDGNGVSKFDGKSFTNYTTVQGLANNVVYSITEDKIGNIWMGTNGGGVSKFDGEQFTNYTTAKGLANNAVRDIAEDKSGNLWFGTLGGGVSKYDGSIFTNYTTTQGLANDTIRSIIQDTKGNFWFGTNGGGLSKFDGKVFTNYSTAQGLADNTVWRIIEDNIGNLWLGTNGGGVSKFDGKKFTNYTTKQGLANNVVRSIVEDEKGNYWFGTDGGGLSKFSGNSFINYTTVHGLANNIVYSINEDKSGNLWLGTSGGGASKYDGKRFTNYTTAQGLANNKIYSIAIDQLGNSWFGTSGSGVSKFDGKSFTNYTIEQGLANNTVFSIIEDKTRNLWFGTSGAGVSKFDGKSFTNYTTQQGLANNEVFCILQDKKGNYWFGTSGGGVSKFDGKSFTNYTTEQGLASNVVWTITEDKAGNLWFGTQNGLSLMRFETIARIDENLQTKKPFFEHLFESFTTKDGLPDNFVTQVVQGNNEKLYIGTNLGFCELSPGKIGNGSNKKWTVGKVFNSLTAYPVKDINAGPGAMFKDSKGIIWIGTGSDKTGLVRFDPQAIVNSSSKPPVIVIQRVKINNESISWNDLDAKHSDEKLDSNSTAPNITEEVNTFGRLLSQVEKDSLRKKFGTLLFDGIRSWNPVPENLVLPHSFNDISFDFNAIETGRNFLVKYQYMLEGYDKDWSPPDNKSSANFGNIYSGTYTFKIKAQSPDGVWSEPVSYTFKVLPPWWKTWWMYLVYLLVFLAALRLFFRWRQRRIILERDILEKKVKHRTEQLNKSLEDLKSTQSQLIQSEKMASLGELTAGIAHEIQNPLNFVNNFSEVNAELIEELVEEVDKGNIAEAKAIAKDIKDNELKINQHGKRAEAIVKGMMQHSQPSTGKKEPTDINALCDEYLRVTYHGLRVKDKSFNATIKTDFDNSIGNINIIPQDIGRVVLNLLTNAFYAAPLPPEGGFLDPDDSKTPTIWVSTKKILTPLGDGGVLISVKDNGPGIPQKIIDKIFQPFFTTKPTGQGTGLGLSLSYDIVKAHGGELKVETKEGEGTTFIIQLPI